MGDGPEVLAVHGREAAVAELRDELRERLPDLDVGTADPEDDPDLADVRVVLAMNLSEQHLAAAPDLEWVHAMTAGVDHFPTDRLRERGIVLTNASGVHAEPIAEQVLGYVLVFERNLHRGIRQQQRREWDRFGGGELRDRTLGIVGVGAIGGRTAGIGADLGMTVLGTKRDPGDAPDAVDEIYGPDGLDRLLDRSDYLILACPLTDRTRGLIGPGELERMDDEAVLVNVARGEIVDEAALIDALESEAIGGAALDVFSEEPLPEDSPLWGFDDVVITPHMAGSTPHYWARNADLFAENYPRFEAGDLDDLTNRAF